MHDLKVAGPRVAAGRLPSRGLLSRDSTLWPALVALAFLGAELTPALLRMPLGADEITYIARTSVHASGVSLPPVHGQGAGLLAAPVTLFTMSLTIIRAWMSVLSAIGLFLSLMCWRRLRPMWVIALAGLILGCLAISQNSGVQIYPDWWGGLATLALTGLFLHAVNGTARGRVVLPLIAFVSMVIILMRPQNVVFLMGPVILATLLVRPWRKMSVLIAMIVGCALGALEWIIGAELWFGGLSERIHLAGQEPPSLKLWFSLGTQLKVLNGPWYCIPPKGCTAWAAPAESPWWLAFLALAILGLCVNWLRSTKSSAVLAAATAFWIAALYVLLVPFGAPRYIIPSFALMAILSADAIAWMVTEARWRKTGIAFACLFLVSGIVSQRIVLQREAAQQTAGRQYEAVANKLIKEGVKPPCVLVSPSAAYYVGCSAPWTGMRVPDFLARTPEGLAGWVRLSLRPAAVWVPVNSPLISKLGGKNP